MPDRIRNKRDRQEWLLERHRLPDGSIDTMAIARASRQKRAMERQAVQERALRPAAAPPAVIPYWTPLGPSVVAHGQASGNPVVSGRVTAIAVGPGGRVYVGAANGGVWFSPDSGATWTPIDEYAFPLPVGQQSKLDADSLSTGAIAVRFGASAAQDEIYVGTGEPPGGFSAQYAGVGIKHSTGGGSPATWGPLEAGDPGNVAGLGVYRIVIDPDHSEVVFAATTGGLFMRPRGGASVTSWTNITAGLPAAPITDLVIAGTGANKVYAAAASSGAIPAGWLVASNAKDPSTWAAFAEVAPAGGSPGLTAGQHRFGLVFVATDGRTTTLGPVNKDGILTAATFAASGGKGLQITINPNKVWPGALPPSFRFPVNAVQLAMTTASNPDRWFLVPGSTLVFASGAGNSLVFNISTDDTTLAGQQEMLTVFRSADAASDPGGGHWTAVAGIVTSGRVALAASEDATSPRVYALDQSPALYRVDNAPAGSFVKIPGVPSDLAKSAGDQSAYDLVLAVDPSNSALVYVAGAVKSGDLGIYKGAVTLGVYHPSGIGKGIHADGHVIAFATKADGTHDVSNVWVGCDGGVFQSTQSGANGSFQSRNEGLAITQINFIAQHPDTDEVFVAGTQDNGTVRFRGDQIGVLVDGGDGGGCAYDPNNGYRLLHQYTNAQLYKSTDGGDSWDSVKFPPTISDSQKDAAKAESDATGFAAPIAAVAVDASHTLAAFGTNRLWITSDWGDSWVTIPLNDNPYKTNALDPLKRDALGGSVTAIAWASPTTVYVATATSVFRFDQSGGNWTPDPPAALPAGLPGPPITSIAVEAVGPPGKIYVALGGGGADHVWYFDGAAWKSAGLAQATLDCACHAIVLDPAHPDQIYLGTDVGVFKGLKTGSSPDTWNWTVSPAGAFSQNLPESAVRHLTIHPKTRVVRAATHGLGIWEIPLDTASVADPDLYLRANAADAGRVPRPDFLKSLPDPTHQGTTLDLKSSPDIKVVRSSALGKPDTAQDFLGFTSLRGFATDLNTLDTLGTNQIYIEVHNRGKTNVDGAQVRVLLLLADGSVPLPALPADFATRFQNGDPSVWLTAGWHFADPANPYRTLPSALSVSTPQVVQYNVNLDSVGLTRPDKLAAAAFVTTDTDSFSSADTDVNALLVPDKHVAVRVLEVGTDWRLVLAIVLVAVGAGVAIAVVASKK